MQGSQPCDGLRRFQCHSERSPLVESLKNYCTNQIKFKKSISLENLVANSLKIKKDQNIKKAIELRNKGLKIILKPDDSPVTNGDLEVDRLLRKKIGQATPNIPIISEETVNLNVEPLDVYFGGGYLMHNVHGKS